MKSLIIVLAAVVVCSTTQNSKEVEFFRGTDALEPIVLDSYDRNAQIHVNEFIISTFNMRKGRRKSTSVPIDTLKTIQTLISSLSERMTNFAVDSNLIIQPLIREPGCPPQKRQRRRFPCTMHKQLSALGSDVTIKDDLTLQAYPVIFVHTSAYKLAGGGYVAYTSPYSGYDHNYTWYTLVMNIYSESKLIYYDQYIYFEREVLPQGELPEFHIPQAAMDSLVTLTMKGYMDRMK